TNAEILKDLERGVSSIELVIDPTGENGIQLCDAADYDTALSGVLANLAPIALDHRGDAGLESAALLTDWAQRAGTTDKARLAFNLDPLGALARAGLVQGGLDTVVSHTSEVFSALSAQFPAASLLRADGRVVHEAGGSDAQSLGALIASGVDLMRRLDGAGIPPTLSAPNLLFTLSVDANYGLGIAKLRSARRLWARVLDALHLAPAPMSLQAVTSARILTKYDPWVNMLRGTAACFAATVGGADIVTVRPFNEAIGIPDALGRRIARNTQIIAMEESGVGRVADPAGGAWFTETLAEQLADAAWTEFQQIEAEGGYGQSLIDGALQARIAEVRARRAEEIARRKIPVTGVSEFPLLDEIHAPTQTVTPDASRNILSRAALTTLCPSLGERGDEETEAEPLWPIRLAAPFERLRDHAEQQFEKTGKRPAIYLATIGPLAEHNARADFARNLFAAGGIEAKSPPVPAETIADSVAGFIASGCRLAVLCGSDTRYEADLAEAAKALKGAGVQRLYLAGRHEADGIDSHIFLGVDVIATLELAHAELGLIE
ncbi:MAG: methylmalonyl-CoA mutase family protein, partial [Pseudomonadota bacterium]